MRGAGRDEERLTGLLARIEASDGTLTITSPAGRGTAISATLPLGGWVAGAPLAPG